MRSLKRNERTIYYANYIDKTEITDEYGNATGSYEINYTTPTPYRINVSPARGSSDDTLFGTALNYTKTMVTADLNCPIDENTVLWVDKVATVDDEGNTNPYDYTVTQVGKSLSSIAYAIKKVDVN